jgi:hypothetical protein
VAVCASGSQVMKVLISVGRRAGEPSGLLFTTSLERSRRRPNLLAVFGSVCVHVCGIAMAIVLGTVPPVRPVVGEVTMIRLHDTKLVWYVPKGQLPEVAPGEQSNVGKPKVEVKRPGQVIRSDTSQPKGKQLVWQPAPKIALERETPLPNLLAFVPKPAMLELRKFVAPAQAKAAVEPPRALTEPAPQLAPATPVPLPLATAALPGPAKPRPRDFVPPAKTGSGQSQGAVILEAAPSLKIETGQPSMVIVGLEPVPANNIPLPEGARSPRFSAGPESGTGGQQRSAAVIVPGLTVEGKSSGSAVVPGAIPKAPPLYQQEPSPAAWAQAASGKDSRRVARSMMSAALRPGARVIAPAVESHFPNRPVYTTSFEVGADGAMEWVIWFAEQDTRDARFLTVRPPVPWSRVDPGPDPSSLLPGRLEIAAVIDKTGLPASVHVLNAPNQSLADAGAQMINGWVFLPALRNGEPVSVDALIELSFRRRP